MSALTGKLFALVVIDWVSRATNVSIFYLGISKN